MGWRHAVENGCQPPNKICKKCQEIRHKEEEATKRRLGTGGFPLVLTRTRRAATAKWADGMCKLHARQAGRSEEKYKEEEMKKQHQQMKLPLYDSEEVSSVSDGSGRRRV